MAHVVTRPNDPTTSKNGLFEVHQVLSWSDNLIWLLVDKETRVTAAVDGPEADGVVDYCKQNSLDLTTILNTHTHPDHVGINRDLEKRGLLGSVRVVGPAKAAAQVPGLTEPVDDGDVVEFGSARGRVLLTEGHIDGHVSYLFDDLLFCGDTLFAGGCGYLFDGPPAKMHDSLRRLGELPGETRVFCAHEYTQDNLRFAWSVEPDNAELAKRIRHAWSLRAQGKCTVPSTIAIERETNPFMRTDSPSVVTKVGATMKDVPLTEPADVFAATRALKDRKDYKQIDDGQLPL